MELLFFIERVLWAACVLGEALVLCRLAREGLMRRYPFFAAFLVAESACSLVLMQTVTGRAYPDAFRICTLIMTVFRLGVAGELYERICEHFPGIGRFRAGMAVVLVLLAALFSISTFRPNLLDHRAFPWTVVVVVQRFQSEILAGALTLTWIFLRFVLSIRQPFQPNVLNHWRIGTIYFGVSGAAYLADFLTGQAMAVLLINSAMLTAHLGCFFAWFRLLRRSGEKVPAFQRLSTDQVQAVEQYNRALFETVRLLPGEISARQAENRDIP